jgi:DNA helicase-2/ATP-dependent DNA helicase PcrA
VRRARAEGVDPRAIAIFYRIHAQSRVLEEGMRAANVPYQIVGGTKFYERAEVKDAIAYLRILVNPQSDVDLLRVVNVPARGIGQTTVERLVAWATTRRLSVFEALGRANEVDELAAAAHKKLSAFRALLDRLRAAADATSPSELLERVLSDTGYLQALEKEDSAEADARAENLRELIGSLVDYEAEAAAAGEPAKVAGYLERVTLVSDADSLDESPRVVMMTVHGAKGLEFEHVVLTGMEEEMFPYKGIDPGEREELEEERRLAYVAITRARRQLVMTHVQTRQIFGTTRYSRPSRFIGELPRDVAEHHATPAMKSERGPGRYVDREGLGAHAEARATRGAWRHPQLPSGSPSDADTSGRFVDHSFFDDQPPDVTEVALRRGSRVRHDRFGEGEVRGVSGTGEPAVIAFFPGWGEKKILARFLKPAG